MTTHSWSEVQALGVKAASGAGVPAAQALAFGATLARYLADGGGERAVSDILNAPQRIVTLALRVERVIEAASIGVTPVRVIEDDTGLRGLLISWLMGLPCQSDLKINGNTIEATLTLAAPSGRSRPDRVALSPALESRLQVLAAKTLVPDSDASRSSGAGAGQMDID